MTNAVRSLASRPGFTAVAIVTLAVGFGVNAAIFSLTRTVLLRPLPYRDVDRLVLIGEASAARRTSYSGVVPANYVAWRQRVTAFEELAAWRFVYFTLSGQVDPPIRVQGVIAAPTFFPLLGITPLLGRQFTPDEARPGNDHVLILSNGFWRREFGADPHIVGRTLTVDGTPCAVVGVLPETFKFFHVLNRELEIWRPFVLDPTDREHSISLYGKLKPGVTLSSARAELVTAFAALPAEAFRDKWTADIATLSTRFTANQRPILEVLEVAVALVMCIAAANIANLLLAVAAARRKEVAVRVALGATRWQLMMTLGRETLLLSGAGAIMGILSAYWVVDLLNESVSYQDINRLEPFRVDLWVVVFTGGLAIVTACLFALLPAHRASDTDVIDALKESSHGATSGVAHRRMRGALLIAELTLSIVLLTSALELSWSALSLNGMNRGVDTGRVMTAQLSLNGRQYADTKRLTRFAEAIVDRLNVTAGVDSASVVNYPPLSVVGTIGERTTPLFPQSDAFWIPRTIRRPPTIVGVVEDVREDGIPGHPDDRAPQLYLPYSQNPTRIMTVVTRPRGVPAAATPLIRDAVRTIDRDQPTFDEKTLDDVKFETFARSREVAWLIGAFALLALVLSAVGVYGVISYLTAARNREIGIRMALGASKRHVMSMIVGGAMQLALIGSAIGVVLTPMAITVERTLISGIDRLHPISLAAVVTLLAAVCAVAAAIPAHRAANAITLRLR